MGPIFSNLNAPTRNITKLYHHPQAGFSFVHGKELVLEALATNGQCGFIYPAGESDDRPRMEELIYWRNPCVAVESGASDSKR